MFIWRCRQLLQNENTHFLVSKLGGKLGGKRLLSKVIPEGELLVGSCKIGNIGGESFLGGPTSMKRVLSAKNLDYVSFRHCIVWFCWDSMTTVWLSSSINTIFPYSTLYF